MLPEGAADSVEFFLADAIEDGQEEYVAFFDGDTLPVVTSGVRIVGEVTGYDPDALDGVGTVSEYQARLVDDTGRHQTLGPDRIFRAERLYTDRQSYKLECRARDAQNRWSTPSTLGFFVNFPSRFVTETVLRGQPFLQSPLPGEVLQVASGDSILTVEFAVNDPDRTSPSETGQRIEWRYKFDRYPAEAGGTGAETFFSGWVEGDRLGRFRTPRQEVIPLILQIRGPFVSGDYTLTMQAREFRPSSERILGKRVSTRKVSFRIEAQ